VQFLLLTGLRRNEAALLRREEVSADFSAIRFPADRIKTRVAFTLPLSQGRRRHTSGNQGSCTKGSDYLAYKEAHIDGWTYEDTAAWLSCMNWRARLFFNEKEKFAKRLEVLRQVYDETGEQPASLPQAELDKLLKPYKPGWLQVGVVSFPNDIMGAAIIIWYLSRQS
jgi:hypothetical protein